MPKPIDSLFSEHAYNNPWYLSILGMDEHKETHPTYIKKKGHQSIQEHTSKYAVDTKKHNQNIKFIQKQVSTNYIGFLSRTRKCLPQHLHRQRN